MKQGTIALDIDGTITADKHSIPAEVSAYLANLARAGWQIVFITGRTFTWAYAVLKGLDFPYYLAVQNGAIILDMPKRSIISKRYLTSDVFMAMNEICCHEATDYVIYGGVEQNDLCYFRPKLFSKDLLYYVQQRSKALGERWISLDNYDTLDWAGFPSIKCFGDQSSAWRIAEKIKLSLDLNASPIRDPFDENCFIVQATHPLICKGQALKDISQALDGLGCLIAAGDDLNDTTMLAAADVKIVMSTAPQQLLAMADIIAPSAFEKGIIAGLKTAILKKTSI